MNQQQEQQQNTSTPLTARQRAVVVRIMSEARIDKRPIQFGNQQQISSTPLTTRQIFEKYTKWQTYLQTRSTLSRFLLEKFDPDNLYIDTYTQEEDDAGLCFCCDNYRNCNNPDEQCYDVERCEPYADDDYIEEYKYRGPWFPEFNKQQVRRELKLRNPKCSQWCDYEHDEDGNCCCQVCGYEHDEDGKCSCQETREIVQVEEQPILAALYEPEDIAHLPIVWHRVTKRFRS